MLRRRIAYDDEDNKKKRQMMRIHQPMEEEDNLNKVADEINGKN